MVVTLKVDRIGLVGQDVGKQGDRPRLGYYTLGYR